MSGRRIRDQVINEGQPSNAKRRAEELMAIGESPAYLFSRVVRQYSMGNPVPLIKYLCTNHPLSPTDRKQLALALAEAFGRQPLEVGRGVNTLGQSRPSQKRISAALTATVKLDRCDIHYATVDTI